MDLSKLYLTYLVDLTGLQVGFWKAGEQLLRTPFVYDNEMDENRRYDGMAMRRIFATDNSLSFKTVRDELNFEIGECSVLEMIVGLAWRMDRDIMYNPDFGSRVHVWCEAMLRSLDIWETEADRWYSYRRTKRKIDRWLSGNYEPNGEGGLFTIRNIGNRDLRDIDIWTQMNWWLEANYKEEFYFGPAV